jgi:hypothetical protein
MTPVANLPSLSTTANFANSTACVVDTGGNFVTGVNDTGGKIAASVNDTSGKLPPVSTTPVVHLNISANFRKNSKRPQWYTQGLGGN